MATLYVGRKVGAGGFERLVGIKRVHPHLLTNLDFHDMFRDEARVCSVIRHPNVVSLLDVVDADGELFLVLDYVESLSLSELARAASQAQRPLAPAVVSRILVDALAGLHAAHEAVDLRGARLDVIHRDVSPPNIIVGVDGTSRLIDFGIAKAASRVSVTNSNVLKGKLRYMSPEQIQQKPLDRRSDIFAAGVVLFEMLTGRRLLGGEDEGDIALGVLLGAFPAPSSIVPDLPPGLDEVVAKALARDREERFQLASDLQEALERVLPPASPREVGRVVEELGVEVIAARREALRNALDAQAAGTSMPNQTATVTELTPTSVRVSRRLIAGGGALLAVATIGVAALVVLRGSWERPASESARASSAQAVALPSSAEPRATPSAIEGTPAASSIAAPLPGSAASPIPPPPARKGSRVPAADLHRKNPYGTP
jgi:serine/threonine-protein kinase